MHEDVAEKFKTSIVEQLKDSFPAGGRGEKYLDTDKGAMINTFHTDRIKSYLNESHGGKVLAGVKSDEDIKDAKNNWIPPTIIEDPNLESSIMTQEIFGPILPILTFKNIDDVIKFIKERPKPLAIYYFGCLIRGNSCKIKKETSSGSFVVNEVAFQAVHPGLPFGGVGNSGYGHYHGRYGFKAMSHAKA